MDGVGLAYMCKAAISAGYGSLTVSANQLDDAWKWTQNARIALFTRLDMLSSLALPEIMFREIKSAFTRGADGAELVLPPSFFMLDFSNVPSEVDEYLGAAAEAAAGRPLKIAIETSFLSNAADIKATLALVAGYGFAYIKSASGLYASSSTLAHLNAMLEEAWFSPGLGVDFLFEPTAGEHAAEGAFRLARKILKDGGRIVVSIPHERAYK
ncbi:MAG: hypothetical protein LBL52_00380 [Rickettsiales bacterium]|nr:hypothetical protein [Rickettsiales bacterium]